MNNKIYIALMIYFIVLMSSCRVLKNHKETISQSTVKSDSLVHIEKTSIDTVKIEADIFKAEVALEELKKGTPFKFRSKKGRAHTKVQLNDGVLQINTRCDSLERYVLSTQIYIKETQNQLSEFKQIIEDQKTIIKSNWFYKVGFFGLLALNVLLLTKGLFNKFTITKK